jgi:putative peptidoglycan lipid II flippase
VKDTTLFRNALAVGLGTLLSRVSGLAREILISSFFGATWTTDAFLIAYTIPNLLRRLFAEGALSTSVVPIFSRYVVDKSYASKDQSEKFVSAAFSGFTLIVGAACLLGIAFSPWIVRLVAFGFREEPSKLFLTTRFTQIMFPFLLLVSWSALVMGFLNTLNIFSWSAIAPFFFNLGTIVSVFFLRRALGPYALAWGVILGGMGQFLFQVPPLWQKGLLPKLEVRFWEDEGFRQVTKLMLPVTFSLAVSQLNTLVDRIVASLCREGAVSALYFSDRLMEFPLGIFGVALSIAILPPLSQNAWSEDMGEWKRILWQGIRWILFFMLPATVFLMVFSLPIVNVVYRRGVFDALAAKMTSLALLFYAPGLLFFSLNHLLTRAFYSLRDTKTPVRISVFAVLLNVVLDVWLVRFLDFRGVALATSVSAFFQFVLLLFSLRRKVGVLWIGFPKDWAWKVGTQLAVFAGFCRILGGRAGEYPKELFLLLSLGIWALYIAFSFLLKMDERKVFTAILRGREKQRPDLEV